MMWLFEYTPGVLWIVLAFTLVGIAMGLGEAGWRL